MGLYQKKKRNQNYQLPEIKKKLMQQKQARHQNQGIKQKIQLKTEVAGNIFSGTLKIICTGS